jgi:quaternary ammonium compound-resistance protein SugE
MAWLYLLIAGFFEIGWAMGMKFNHGFTRFWPTAAMLACMVGSLAFLSFALKSIPIGTGYAIWTGIGAAGTAAVGMIWLGESGDAVRVVCVGFIIMGVLGLKFAADRKEQPSGASSQIRDATSTDWQCPKIFPLHTNSEAPAESARP